MQVGTAAADMTPPIGITGRLGIDHVLDREGHPCMARALYLEDGEHRALQVTAETVGFTRGVTARVRAEVARATGVAAEAIIIVGTHTHSSPWMWEEQDDEAKEQGMSFLDRDYLAGVVAACATAAMHAVRDARERPLAIGTAVVDRVASNRVQCGFRGATCADAAMRSQPEGDVDPQVRVLVIGPREAPHALIANYACHPAAYGGGKTLFASPDFPYHAESMLRTRFGTDVPLCFWMGCSGDINTGKYVAEGSHEEVEALGRRFATGVAQAVHDAGPLQGRLAVHHTDVLAEAGSWLPSVSDARVEFREMCEEVRRVEGPVSPELVGRWRMAIKTVDRALLVRGSTIPARVQMLSVGDARFVFLPGEWFHTYGMELARLGPPGRVWTTTMADLDLLYMPDSESLARGGGYGVDTRMRTLSDAGIRTIVEAAKALAEEEW